jgi:5S rRNA maturation endonuclease (ribonuclease M5)
MIQDEKEEKMKNLIEMLKEEESALILVEGQRDVEALRALGITHHMVKVSGRRMFDDFSLFEGKNIIILTDFDRTGRLLFNRLRKELEIMGYNPNMYYWMQIKKLTKGVIKAIEELDTYVHTL